MTTNDEKRGRHGQEEFENFLRGGKIVALLATLSAHGRQSESNFWCGVLAPWETIVHRDPIVIVGRNRVRETTVSPDPIPISQLDIRFIDIFSQSFERLYLLLYNVVYLALVHRCCTRDYPPCFGPRRTLVDQIGGGQQKFNRETDQCLYEFYFEQKKRYT